MSITLMAYPMAFLINPEEAKNEKLKRASDDKVVNEEVATENLRAIRVLTNINIVSQMDCEYTGFKMVNIVQPFFLEEKTLNFCNKMAKIFSNNLTNTQCVMLG